MLRLGLFADLFRQPLWLIGAALDVVAAALQGLALHFGPLSVVQPLLVLGLLLVVPLAAVVARRRPRRIELWGAALCVAGLIVFLAVAHPSAGDSTVSTAGAAALLAAGSVAAAACVVAARVNAALRATWLAAGAGVAYGVSATALKLTTDDITRGFVPLFTHWPVYALAGSAAIGMLLNQNAFQAGSLPTPMAAMTVVEPVIAVVIGTTLLHERFHVGIAGLVVVATGLLAMAAGIVLLARGRAELDIERVLAPDTHDAARTAEPVR